MLLNIASLKSWLASYPLLYIDIAHYHERYLLMKRGRWINITT